MNVPYASDRYFQVWTYSVTSRRLLLRSTGGGGIGTRIDIFFAGVERMLLRPDYEGISIREAGPERVSDLQARYGEWDPRCTLFLIGTDLDDFVVSGVAQWHEDDGGYRDVSHFGGFFGSGTLGAGGES